MFLSLLLIKTECWFSFQEEEKNSAKARKEENSFVEQEKYKRQANMLPHRTGKDIFSNLYKQRSWEWLWISDLIFFIGLCVWVKLDGCVVVVGGRGGGSGRKGCFLKLVYVMYTYYFLEIKKNVTEIWKNCKWHNSLNILYSSN